MSWVRSSEGVEEWVEGAVDAPQPARKLTLAEQIAATRAKVASEVPSGAANSAATPAVQPKKMSLAEQIAATRAKAAAASSAEADAKAARAARAAAKAEAEAAEAEAEARAETEAERRQKMAADMAAKEEAANVLQEAMAEAEAGTRKLTLAEQIAATRAQAASEAAAAKATREATALPMTMPIAASATPPGYEWCVGDGALPAKVAAAVDAGRVDETHQLLSDVPPALRHAPPYEALRRQLLQSAQENDARRRALLAKENSAA